MSSVAEALAGGLIGSRLWLYSNYHCNLSCTYCLSDSSSTAPRRELPLDRLVELAEEARELGFESIGITGGEPFLVPGLPDILPQLVESLPVLVLSNGTLFTDRLIHRLRPVAGPRFAIQISLDSARPDLNDELRGPLNFRKVVLAIPRLRAAGIAVRIATTSAQSSEADQSDLCALHRSLGVRDEDHIVRPIVARGRAAVRGLGVQAARADLPAELTITADGAYWSPFGPTIRAGRLDTDLLVSRTTSPLVLAAGAMIRVAAGTPRTPSGGPGVV